MEGEVPVLTFFKINKKGKARKVSKEIYLRDDVCCGIKGCCHCPPSSQTSCLAAEEPILLPSAAFLVAFIDFVESDPSFNNCCILSSVLNQFISEKKPTDSKVIFEFHLNEKEIQKKIKNEKLKKGKLKIHPDCCWRGTVVCAGEEIKIIGRRNLNRAFEGDIVAVEVIEEDTESSSSSSSSSSSRSSSSSSSRSLEEQQREEKRQIEVYAELLETEDDPLLNDPQWESPDPDPSSSSSSSSSSNSSSSSSSGLLEEERSEEVERNAGNKKRKGENQKETNEEEKEVQKDEKKENQKEVKGNQEETKEEEEIKEKEIMEKEIKEKEIKEKEIKEKEKNKKEKKGKVVGIIQKGRREFFGSLKPLDETRALSSSASIERIFVPVDPRIPNIIIKTRQSRELDGKRIAVAVDAWAPTQMLPRGHWTEILGDFGDTKTEG
ncbi:hypothetical protein, conserved [Eimeria tenella]|uniref:CSD2 domain-containing protein n=1 Tax=Eimeria tenella TaxID=5802 RepID=U6KNT5_EIMTE|nr:hypothetical protein, conserved [Eimeria tenella]CDJ39641.1 hypothetical protein, conserved [Eimeria tenella]|eukprot:XP_013230396.1 hypothetical protein, conserved [Eimeria tenella]